MAAGVGIAIAPRSAIVLPNLQSRRLVDPAVDREIGLIVPASEALSPAAALVQAAKERAWPGIGH